MAVLHAVCRHLTFVCASIDDATVRKSKEKISPGSLLRCGRGSLVLIEWIRVLFSGVPETMFNRDGRYQAESLPALGTYGASISFDASARGCTTVFERFQGKGLLDASSAPSVTV